MMATIVNRFTHLSVPSMLTSVTLYSGIVLFSGLCCMQQLARGMAQVQALATPLLLGMLLGMALPEAMASWTPEETLCQAGGAEALPLGEGATCKVTVHAKICSFVCSKALGKLDILSGHIASSHQPAKLDCPFMTCLCPQPMVS